MLRTGPARSPPSQNIVEDRARALPTISLSFVVVESCMATSPRTGRRLLIISHLTLNFAVLINKRVFESCLGRMDRAEDTVSSSKEVTALGECSQLRCKRPRQSGGDGLESYPPFHPKKVWICTRVNNMQYSLLTCSYAMLNT